MIEAQYERRLRRFQRQLAGVELLIIDKLGFVPLSKSGAELLFELISQRYERGATIITSNLPFDEWTGTSGDERLTGALIDRLTHHVHILEMNGKSCRLSQCRARRAAKTPLSRRKPAQTGRNALARASYMGSARAKVIAHSIPPLSNSSGRTLRRHPGGVSRRH